MSKILKNTTVNPISISDTGITILASPGQYTIPAQDYLLWAASNDVITFIGNGDIIVNDGSTDLNVSDGVDLIKGIFPKRIGITSGDDFTSIGHVNDSLKVSSINSTGFIVPMINREDINTTETANGNSGTLESDGFGCLNTTIEVTSISGTNASIQVEIQTSDDNSTWSSSSNTRRFTSVGVQRFISTRLTSRYYRYIWIVLGSSPSVTFKITTTLKAYLPRAHVQINNYSDFILGTSGNISSTFKARDTDQLSLMIIRPASPIGTGQYRIQGSNDEINYVDITGTISISNNETLLHSFSDKAFTNYRCICSSNGGGAAVCDLFWGASG